MLDGSMDLGVRVALLLAEETVDMTDGEAFLWEDEEEEDDCFECRRRVPPREGMLGNCPVNRPNRRIPGDSQYRLVDQERG